MNKVIILPIFIIFISACTTQNQSAINPQDTIRQKLAIGISEIEKDPFKEPKIDVFANCGPEYRYQYTVKSPIKTVDDLVTFLELVREMPIKDSSKLSQDETLPEKDWIPARFKVLSSDFFRIHKDKITINKLKNEKTIFYLKTNECSGGYEEFIISDIGQISFYACCGI